MTRLPTFRDCDPMWNHSKSHALLSAPLRPTAFNRGPSDHAADGESLIVSTCGPAGIDSCFGVDDDPSLRSNCTATSIGPVAAIEAGGREIDAVAALRTTVHPLKGIAREVAPGIVN